MILYWSMPWFYIVLFSDGIFSGPSAETCSSSGFWLVAVVGMLPAWFRGVIHKYIKLINIKAEIKCLQMKITWSIVQE